MRFRALWLCLALLASIEFGIARRDAIWGRIGKSPSGAENALHTVAEQWPVVPKVVILGSSRIRDALAPAILAKSLHLEAHDVINLGITTGGPLDALRFYERHRARWAQAQELIIGVEDWWLDGNKVPTERERRHATLRDRWCNGYPFDIQLDLTVGWCWRTYDARNPLRRLLKSSVLGSREDVPVEADGRLRWRPEGDVPVSPSISEIHAWVDTVYRDFRVEPRRLRPLDQLLPLAKQDGLRVWLIQVPLHDAYLARVRNAYANPYRLYREEVERRADRDSVRVEVFEEGSSLGIGHDDFFDYGHLKASGAARFSQRFGELVRQARRQALLP